MSVVRDGTYQIECRHFPREADKELGATKAKIKIGEVEQEMEVKASDKSAVFEVELKAGDYDLETWMTVGKGTRGALFVYVSAK